MPEKTTPQPATKNLDFSAALTLMKGGKKIQRASWTDAKYLYIDAKYLWAGEKQPTVGSIQCMSPFLGENGNSRFALHERDILASDWQIVE